MTYSGFRSVLFPFLILCLISLAGVTAQAQNDALKVDSWLLLGPVETQLPIYHSEPDVNNRSFTKEELLKYDVVNQGSWQPESGRQVEWSGDEILQWYTETSNEPLFGQPDSGLPAYGWAAFYLESDRFATVALEVSSHHPFIVYLNGEELAAKMSFEEAGSQPGIGSADVSVTQGKHLVMIRTLYHPEAIESPWGLQAEISGKTEARLNSSIDPKRYLDLETLSNQPQIGSLALSEDGSLVAMRLHQPAPPDGVGDSWLEIRKTDTGELYREFRGAMDIGNIQWAPDGNRFTYIERSDSKSSLWLVDLDAGSQSRLLREVDNFSSYQWSPDGSFIIYSISTSRDSDPSGVWLLDDLEDRRPWHFTRNFLYKLNVPEGTTRRLTAGLLSTSLNDISPDGSKLLFSRSHTDYSVRPYSVTEYQLLDITTLQTDSLFTVPFGGSGQFSPDGRKILFTGGPSMFDDLGTHVPEGMVANDYDTQAYIYEIASGDMDPITLQFDPSIGQAVWGGDPEMIYFSTTDRSYQNLYCYEVENRRFELLETEKDVVQQFDISQKGQIAVYSGTGISSPAKAYLLNLQTIESELLIDPGEKHYRQVEFGDDKVWRYTTTEGREIDGYVYYPPDFDPDNSYPVITYYYGGTVPVSRAFGGRYPKELYAANGYIVFVMQPSGAIGYGQEFSALHVNDWGNIVADEIIEGVDQFLEAHPYADHEREGAIGASYGGFMTMLLLTRTDLFAAGVSHAGISNIASYWGEGFWGFQYSAIATAESFPWNREDIYVGQSPLYSADQVTTPLLFVTGMSDTNVPPGESLQMYTALKLLERETAFVAVENQDHHIVDYKKYKLWKESILAWFDKYLKDQPAWWEYKYED